MLTSIISAAGNAKQDKAELQEGQPTSRADSQGQESVSVRENTETGEQDPKQPKLQQENQYKDANGVPISAEEYQRQWQMYQHYHYGQYGYNYHGVSEYSF